MDENRGFILKTTDGGDTWTTVDSATIDLLSSITFTNPATGYAVGYNDEDYGYLLKTTDGGQTWSSHVVCYQYTLYSFYFNTVCFPAQDTGYIFQGSTSTVYKSTDGGTSWSNIGNIVSNLGFKQLSTMYFVNPDTGFAVGDSGMIFKTVNGGYDWTMKNANPLYNLRSVYFLNETTGLASGVSGTILRTTDCGETWSQVPTGVTAVLYGINFFGQDTGFVIGGTEWPAPQLILKTTDGGLTWSHSDLALGGINAVFFANSTTGYGVGGGGKVMKTTDGGDNWNYHSFGTDFSFSGVSFQNDSFGCFVGGDGKIVTTHDGGKYWDFPESGTTAGLNSVNFPDASTGYIAGNSGIVLQTRDGGETWQRRPGIIHRPSSIYFVDTDCGYAISPDSIERTTDGGHSWTASKLGSYIYARSVFFTSKDTGFVAGYADNGQILKTTDGGLTWIITSLPEQIHSICFPGRLTGYAVGTEGAIYKTVDGGESWNPMVSGTSEYLTSVAFSNVNRGFALGYEGFVLTTADGGLTWEKLDGLSALSAYYSIAAAGEKEAFAAGGEGRIYKITLDVTSLPEKHQHEFLSIYPNPADHEIHLIRPSTSISKGLMTVSDLTGHTILEQHFSGESTAVDVSALSAGIYFVRLINEKGIYSGKFIKN